MSDTVLYESVSKIREQFSQLTDFEPELAPKRFTSVHSKEGLGLNAMRSKP